MMIQDNMEEKRIQKEARPWGILHLLDWRTQVNREQGEDQGVSSGKSKRTMSAALRDECCRNPRCLQCGISEALDDLDAGLDSDSWLLRIKKVKK